MGSSMAVLPVKNWFKPPASCYSQAWLDRAHVGHQSHVTADALKQLCKLVLKYSRHCYDVYTQKNLSEQNKCVGKSSYIKLANLLPKITTKNNAFCLGCSALVQNAYVFVGKVYGTYVQPYLLRQLM